MVKGEPTHHNVGGVYLECLSYGADVGEEIGMAENDALGVTRTPRCVLEEGNVLVFQFRSLITTRRRREVLDCDQVL